MGLVGTDLVVVAGEEIDAALECVEGIELIVGTEPLLEGLVVALDLALGLGRRFQPVSATNSANFSDGVMNPSVARGLPLRLRWMRLRSAAECWERSVPRGMYWRRSPLVFSLEPRCQGERGSQK